MDAIGPVQSGRLRLRTVGREGLTPQEVSAIRDLLMAAFGVDDEGFTDDDWEHAIGGVHFLLELDGAIVSHAAVVERELEVAGAPLRAGYVEAVATHPRHQGRGFGSSVMRAVGAHIVGTFELGALGTGRHGFYERLGWRTWIGPSSVRTADGTWRTSEDDGFIMVLTTPSSPRLDLSASIACDWRAGDVW